MSAFSYRVYVLTKAIFYHKFWLWINDALDRSVATCHIEKKNSKKIIVWFDVGVVVVYEHFHDLALIIYFAKKYFLPILFKIINFTLDFDTHLHWSASIICDETHFKLGGIAQHFKCKIILKMFSKAILPQFIVVF